MYETNYWHSTLGKKLGVLGRRPFLKMIELAQTISEISGFMIPPLAIRFTVI